MLSSPPRILVVSEIPTPYRLPLYARLASRPEIELDVVFCSEEEPGRPWKLAEALETVPHQILRGFAVPIHTRRDTVYYQVNAGILGLLRRTRYDAIVSSGYSVFAEQAAIAIARMRRIPYLLHSESTLLNTRPAAIRLAKQLTVRPVVAGASAGLAVGSAAARYLEHYGMPASRIRIVPNTIDVEAYGRAANDTRARADEVRRRLALPPEFVLYAGRLNEVKGVQDLAAARLIPGGDALPLVVAGEGPLRGELAGRPGIHMLGFVQPQSLIELFALATWTVVPSRFEQWGVVVNEALACGCPVIATDAVGAAEDLIVDGVNGRIVRAGAPDALAAALSGPRPATDPATGRIEQWTYDFAVDQFLDALRFTLPAGLADGRRDRQVG